MIVRQGKGTKNLDILPCLFLFKICPFALVLDHVTFKGFGVTHTCCMTSVSDWMLVVT